MSINGKLSEIEKLFGHHVKHDWKPDIEFVQQLMNRYANNIEVNIRVLYLLHNILVEEDYPDEEQDYMTALLQKYFKESYQRFSENVEYLYFVSRILHIAEWFFGLNDDDKPLEQRLRFQMEKKAFKKEPNNILYEWEYLHAIDNDKVTDDEKERLFELTKKLLFKNPEKIERLKSKGFPGEYIINPWKVDIKRVSGANPHF